MISYGSLSIVIRLPEKLRTSETSARLVPNATQLVRATVTGAGIASPIIGEVSLQAGHGNTATVSLEVPSGTDRTLLVEAFNDTSRLAQETTLVDIAAGVNLPVALVLQPEAWIFPTASASADPTTVSAGTEVAFGGSGTDADGTVVLYEWDFESDGLWDYSSATTLNTTHTYSQAGSYTATLRVTDDDGLQGSDTVQITVN